MVPEELPRMFHVPGLLVLVQGQTNAPKVQRNGKPTCSSLNLPDGRPLRLPQAFHPHG